MSRYELNRLLYDLKMQDGLAAELRADPERVLARYDLSPAEREALATRDPRQLRQLGAHGMLALYVLRLRPEYDDNVYWTQR
ncbi:MAG TPA: hypothetical protein VFB73_15700 [Chloroflexota bacterium]|nr:hypothetical protein [Chloroflexota bacterium]HZU07408.1 hypothetical protein [Chloroflexota bacterium]